jgi:integrase
MIADEFLKRHTDEKSGPRWAAETKRILDRSILPAIGDTPGASVGKADIHGVLDAITDRGSPIAANRTLAVVKKLFRWALSRGYVDRDPCTGIVKPGDETRRDRVLSDDELARVWRAADGMAYPFGPAVQLLILTGARRDEVGAMRWTEVDLAGKVWMLPSTRTKNGVEHVIPLSDAALRESRRIRIHNDRSDSSIRLVEGEGDVGVTSGVPDWRLHDLRRTVATGLAGLGVSMPVVEKILNHVSGSFGGVAGVYQRFAFADEKREALDKWAEHIKAL